MSTILPTSHETVTFNVGHFFCGIGAGAAGFRRGHARVGSMSARFRNIGGIDVDPAAVRDFERMAGVPGTCLDLFSREQFRAFHGEEPPADWREATVDDVHRAFHHERPHIVFLSAPCKGFSGLLAEKASRTPKYQALNQLTLRGVWLMLEAYRDDPPELIVFENVPRIATRGRPLLDQIVGLLQRYGYATAETTHDCGELGGLAQSRKRFLLVARHQGKVPPFLYEPIKRPLRGVGEVLEHLPLPGDTAGGPMHRCPRLQWRTWVRLAFVEAGSDWRSLNRLQVNDEGFLADYGIEPVGDWHAGVLGVRDWNDTAATVTGRAGPTTGSYSVADPRFNNWHPGASSAKLRVTDWKESGYTVTGAQQVGSGALSIADPRIDGHEKSVQLGVRPWDRPAPVVTGKMLAGGGPNSVADPRVPGTPFNHVYRIVDWTAPGPAVTSANAGTAAAVADPRPTEGGFGGKGKYRVVPFDRPSGTVIAGSTTEQGAFAVADPRPSSWGDKRPNYNGGGHYGVIPWDSSAGTVSSSGRFDNSRMSVADPRLPEATENLVAVIRALDGTWHRPFTTLELAALQGLVDPEEQLILDGMSDSAWRERIGNAVPPPAAEAIAGVMGRTLLMARAGETFQLSAEPIWVRPVAVGLSVARGRSE